MTTGTPDLREKENIKYLNTSGIALIGVFQRSTVHYSQVYNNIWTIESGKQTSLKEECMDWLCRAIVYWQNITIKIKQAKLHV